MTDSRKRRWKLAAAYRRTIKGVKRRTFYRLIMQGKLQSYRPTDHKIHICVGYFADGKPINCLTAPLKNPIDCRKCNIPR